GTPSPCSVAAAIFHSRILAVPVYYGSSMAAGWSSFVATGPLLSLLKMGRSESLTGDALMQRISRSPGWSQRPPKGSRPPKRRAPYAARPPKQHDGGCVVQRRTVAGHGRVQKRGDFTGFPKNGGPSLIPGPKRREDGRHPVGRATSF